MFSRLILFFLLICSSLAGYQQTLLKPADINVIMTQILKQHLGDKVMTPKVLENAIRAYINQFDPNRIYFLEDEVIPFLFPSQAQLNEFLQNYEKGNYLLFNQLNQLARKAILRARALRTSIEKESQEKLFKSSITEIDANHYARSIADLQQRWRSHLGNFIVNQARRYGEANSSPRKEFVLRTYEENLKDFENQYLYQNAAGETLPLAEQENLASLHIIKALASSLDSHTSFYEANEAHDIRLHLQKEFKGLGIFFKETPDGIIASKIIDNSPAAQSKLIKPGDILLKINDKPVSELSFEKIMDLLHNTSQSTFILNFKREASENEPQKLYTVNLKPETIVLNSDRVDVSEEKFGNGIIGIIKLYSFYQGADISSEKDVEKAIQDLEKKGNLKGLILDLRDNRGGFLTQAIKVAGLFITNGVVVISKYADGQEHYYRDIDSKVAYNGPLVVLTSKITASAAEIVAQALQDYGVALVVGDEHTYGKGTIQTQTVTDSQSPSYFKVTVGKYYTVSGRTPQKEGVLVDIVAPSHWDHIEVGEKYANTVEADKISDSFNDPLKDITTELKPWYLKYYIPKLQHRMSIWRDLLPTLKKNSEYRIANNKNYQYYIKGGKDMTQGSDEDLGWSAQESNMNGGEDDLQLKEAVNIVKDMSILRISSKN